MKILKDFYHHNKHIMAKYATVGTLGAIIDFSLLYFLTDFLGLYYLLSATFSFIVGASMNYYLNRRWTFKSSGQKRKQLPIFFSLATMGVLLNINIMYLGVEMMGLHYMIAKIFAAGIVMVWNFLGNKFLTFRIK